MSADGSSGTDIDEAPNVAAPVEPVTLRDLISRNLRRLRLDAAAGHEDVSRAAKRYGLNWTTTWVASVERGQRAPTAEQLIVLPMVLAEAFGHRVGLADLLVGDTPVSLGAANGDDAAPVSSAYLREMVTATPYRRPFSVPGTAFGEVDQDGALARAAAKMREINKAGLGDVDIRALAQAEATAGEVEDKLARKLGVAPIIVIAAAASLWRRSLSDERQSLLTADQFSDRPHPKPATVMRKLTADISAKIEEAAARAAAPPAPVVVEVDSDATPTIEFPRITAEIPREVPRPRPPISLFSPEPA